MPCLAITLLAYESVARLAHDFVELRSSPFSRPAIFFLPVFVVFSFIFLLAGVFRNPSLPQLAPSPPRLSPEPFLASLPGLPAAARFLDFVFAFEFFVRRRLRAGRARLAHRSLLWPPIRSDRLGSDLAAHICLAAAAHLWHSPRRCLRTAFRKPFASKLQGYLPASHANIATLLSSVQWWRLFLAQQNALILRRAAS